MAPEGTVKWFDDDKGYGFINPDDASEDAFVHHTDIVMDGYATLSEGQRVSYELTQTEKGPKALNVKVAEGPGPAEPMEPPEPPREGPSFGPQF